MLKATHVKASAARIGNEYPNVSKGEIVKKKYASILLTLTGLLGMGTAAKAEIRNEIKVTLPFEFVVDGKTLPAGTYTVSRFADDKHTGLILSNDESRTGVFVRPVEVERTSADKPGVSFQRVGEQLFLSSIRTSNDVYDIPVPRSAVLETAGRAHSNATSSEGSLGN
jgi:hypothetical protein